MGKLSWNELEAGSYRNNCRTYIQSDDTPTQIHTQVGATTTSDAGRLLRVLAPAAAATEDNTTVHGPAAVDGHGKDNGHPEHESIFMEALTLDQRKVRLCCVQ